MSYISPVFDVTKFGAVGDGSVDDTPAIQNAINAAVAAGLACVYLPAGRYRITSELTLPSNPHCDLVFKGDGMNVTIIVQAGAGQRGFYASLDDPGPGVEPQYTIELSDLTFEAAAACSTAVEITYGTTSGGWHELTQSTIRHVGIYSPSGVGSWSGGVVLESAWNTTLDHVYADGANSGIGLRMKRRCVNSFISNCQFNFWGTGIRTYSEGDPNNEGVFIANCFMVPCNKGIVVDGSGTALRSTLVSITNCHIDARGEGCIAVHAINVSALLIATTLLISGADGGTSARIVKCERAFESTIVGNQIYGPVTYGIELANWSSVGCAAVSIVGNNFRGPVTDLLLGSLAVGNIISSNTRHDSNEAAQRSNISISSGNYDNVMQTSYAGACALVSKNANQNITSATPTIATWEVADINQMAQWSSGANTRLTVPANCRIVRVSVNIRWASNNVGYRYVFIRKNGSTRVASQIQLSHRNAQINIASSPLPVSGGDYFEVGVEQDTGGNVEVLTDPETNFGMEIIA